MIKLVLPNVKYKKTYLNAVREFEKKGSDNSTTDHYLKIPYVERESKFKEYVKHLMDMHNGKNLKKGFVPSTDYWIIDNKGKYCGRISFRHKLNKKLRIHGGHIGYDIIPSERGKHYATKALELCLKKVKKRGLKKVMLGCDDDNIPSIKVIENNNGVLQDKIKFEGVLTRRYCIKL